MRKPCLPVVVLLLASAAVADQDASGVLRDWRIKYERNPLAVFAGFEQGKALLRLQDGSVRAVDLWMLEGRELAYLQRQRCVFPTTIRKADPPPGKNLLINLSADGLAPGKLSHWENKGALGGAFQAMVTAPVVEDVAGRRAIRFDYGPAIVAMDVNTMVADFFAPRAIMDDGAFTIAAWLYNPGVPQEVETFLSWHTLNGDDGTDIRYGRRGRTRFMAGAYCGAMGTMGFPGEDLGKANVWHHVAHVFTGGQNGEMRLYVDGRRLATKVFERIVRIRPATAIVRNGALLNGHLLARDSRPVTVKFFIGRRDGHYWARVFPTEPDRWNRVVEITADGTGPLSARIDGLQPATDYVYRIQVSLDDDHIYWSDGIGRFRTAGADGKPGVAYEEDDRRFMFVGSSWGSTWDWATTPRHFYTGDIAGLRVYDYPLAQREIRDLCGLTGNPSSPTGEGPTTGASPAASAPSGDAAEPAPADGATGVNVQTAYLTWRPAPLARSQTVYLDWDRKATEEGTARHKLQLGGRDGAAHFPIAALEYGKTYCWRVAADGGQARPGGKGKVWSFVTEDPVTPEYDGPVSEPYPLGVRQWGRVTKFMECGGQPIIAADDTPDLAMLRARKTCLKLLDKRPDLLYRLAVSNTAGSLTAQKELGWTELVCNTYGATKNMLLDQNFYGGANMLIHEMGHQLHMNGMSQLDLDFDHRLHETWLAAMKTGAYLGAYASNNMWEYIACSASAYINDGQADDQVFSRDKLRADDPRLYFLLNEYWSGDRRIELIAHDGMVADANGLVRQWRNSGGVEYWGRQGWSKYDGTVGTFRPVGRPMLATVAGVSAVRLGGSDALVWDCLLRPELAGDHEWSVEFWAYRDRPAGAEEVLLSWGTQADHGARFVWGGGARSYDHGSAGRGGWVNKPAPGAWQHIAFVYAGGGMDHRPGSYKVYVNGRLDHEGRHKLDLAAGVPVAVGGVLKDGRVTSGLAGAVAHVRFYDYDMHPLQVAEHFEKERACYLLDGMEIAGRLLVDMDARRLETCPVYDHRPLYPESLNRPWVRSWANRATLGGKAFNNVWRSSSSTPMPRARDGIQAVRFQGKDYMALDTDCRQASTVEAWAHVEGGYPGGTMVEFDGMQVRSDLLPAGGWHHLAVVKAEGGAAVFVDGRKVDRTVPTAACTRLHIGAHWDGRRWTDCFDGLLAQVRLHSDRLNEQQVRRNFEAGDMNRPVSPVPADGGTVAPSRGAVLSWQAGATGSADFDVYFGTDPAAVAVAGLDSIAYRGRARPGRVRPQLHPATSYCWRVDALDAAGHPAARGKVWRFQTSQGAVVDLNAAALKPGKLEQWPNQGLAGGAFIPGRQGPCQVPTVRIMAGRKAVDFRGGKYLRSTFAVPAGLAGEGGFTIIARLYDPKTWQPGVGVLLGVGVRQRGGLEFGLDQDDRTGAFRGPGGAECDFHGGQPPGLAWHDIAWTYKGGADKMLRIYVDGKANAAKSFALGTVQDGNITLGAAGIPGGRADGFCGLISAVRIYDRPLTAGEVGPAAPGHGKQPTAAGLLVALDANDLPEGPLGRWANTGRLGGQFAGDAEPDRRPMAGEVAGRPAVTFDGSTFMHSTAATPLAVTADRPFTVEMWVHNPSPQPVETPFALAPQAAKVTFWDWHGNGGVACSYGEGGYGTPSAFASGTDAFNMAWQAGPSGKGQWRHLAWVYGGGAFATMSLYVDGKLNATREHLSLGTYPVFSMYLGSGWDTAKGMLNPFSGSIGRLTVYDYAKSADEVAAAAAPNQALPNRERER
jgi:hypothetical protein